MDTHPVRVVRENIMNLAVKDSSPGIFPDFYFPFEIKRRSIHEHNVIPTGHVDQPAHLSLSGKRSQ
jgi:hypothetical protein